MLGGVVTAQPKHPSTLLQSLPAIEAILGEGVVAHTLMHSAPFSNFTIAAVLEAYPAQQVLNKIRPAPTYTLKTMVVG